MEGILHMYVDNELETSLPIRIGRIPQDTLVSESWWLMGSKCIKDKR